MASIAGSSTTKKELPFPGSASYLSAVAIARANIRSIADNLLPRKPPVLSSTSWRRQCGWALRTGLSAMVGMVLAIVLTENDIGAGQVLIPVVALSVVEPTVGATLRAGFEAFRGSLYGAIAAMVSIALATALVPGASDVEAGFRDSVLFVFFVLMALLLTSRQDFALKEKKLSCAVLIVGMALAMGGWEAEDNTVPGWRQPIFVLLSVGGGCLCAFVFSLVPIPGVSENLNPMRAFALSEATARLNFSLNAVQTLLETHISLVVRAEPAELIQAEVVLASLSANQSKLDAILPHAQLEIWCLGWFSRVGWASEAAAGLRAAIALSRCQLPVLRAKQLALRSRSLRGRGAISNVQALWLHQVVPAWCSTTQCVASLADAACWHALAPLVTHRLTRYTLPPTVFEGELWLQNPSSNLRNTLDAAKKEAQERVNLHAETVHRTRVSLFYLFGALHQCHKKHLVAENGRVAAMDTSDATLEEHDDPFASLADAMLSGGPGFVSSDPAAATPGLQCTPLPDLHNPMINPLLYGMEVGSFMDEHNLRIAHAFFVYQHFALCIQDEPSQKERLGENPEKTELQEPLGETAWGQRFVSYTSILWAWSGMSHGPSSIGSRRAALKQTAALSSAAILFFIFRDTTPQAYWAALTISFILTDFSKGLGASVLIGEVRLLGTTLGCMFGLFTFSIVSFEGPWAVLAVSSLIAVWTFASALFRGHPTKGYGAVVSAFTAAIIAHGIYTLDSDSSLTQETLVLARIKMNFLGIAVFVLAESCLWPISARTLIFAAESKVVLAVAHATSAAFALVSDDDCSTARDAHHEGLKALATASGLLDSADVEPTFWRSRFPTRSHIVTIERLQQCLDITSVLENAFKCALAKPSAEIVGMPESVTKAMMEFGVAVLAAVEESTAAWARPSELTSGSRLHSFGTAAAVASPLIALRSLTAESLLQQRNHLLLTLYNRTVPLSQESAMGWMTVTFLCAELSLSLAEVGVAWRDAKAKEVPLCD